MWSSSSINTEISEDEQKDKIKGFHLISLEDVSKYDLREYHGSYVNEHKSNVIPEKELKNSVLIIPSAPTNIDEVHQIDNFIKKVLKEKGKSKKPALEVVLEKLQRKTRDIYRSLARMSNYLEELNNSRDDSLEADIEMLLTCMQHTFLIYCQAIYQQNGASATF